MQCPGRVQAVSRPCPGHVQQAVRLKLFWTCSQRTFATKATERIFFLVLPPGTYSGFFYDDNDDVVSPEWLNVAAHVKPKCLDYVSAEDFTSLTLLVQQLTTATRPYLAVTFAAQVNEEASVVALTVATLTLVAAMDAAQCTGLE